MMRLGRLHDALFKGDGRADDDVAAIGDQHVGRVAAGVRRHVLLVLQHEAELVRHFREALHVRGVPAAHRGIADQEHANAVGLRARCGMRRRREPGDDEEHDEKDGADSGEHAHGGRLLSSHFWLPLRRRLSIQQQLLDAPREVIRQERLLDVIADAVRASAHDGIAV